MKQNTAKILEIKSNLHKLYPVIPEIQSSATLVSYLILTNMPNICNGKYTIPTIDKTKIM